MSAIRLPLLLVKPTPTQIRFWLGLSLLVALAYSVPALYQAFSSEYVIQDDARQHVFWMRRFLDPGLFPNDLMADYFQSVAPWGYSTLYRIFAWVGIDPVVLSKLLPPALGLIATGFCFGVATQILPLPLVGFASATLLNQNLWMRDDLSSGTPGAFFYPIFLAFLYYLLRQSLVPCLITIALQGLFYPQGVFLSAGILLLRLFDWNGQFKRVSRKQFRFFGIGLGVAFLVMLLYAFKSSEFGSVISLAEAKKLPAFSPTGWSAFFSDSFVDFWICGKRSGMIPSEWCELARTNQETLHWWLALLRFPSLWLAGLLSVGMLLRLPLVKQVTQNWIILPQCLLVSIGMFFLAHLLAFKLHLPNRYTEHSFRILLALSAGVSLVILWDSIYRRLINQQRLAMGLSVALIAVLIFYPYSLRIDHQPFPIAGYITGKHPTLYQFFAKQPKDISIASLSEEANQLPTFAQQSLFVGGEGYVVPYHPKYFQQANQRLLELVQAQYSPDLKQVKSIIQRYGIDFWLLDQQSFQPQFNNPKAYLTRLFAQFPTETQPIKAQLEAGVIPALSQINQSCTVYNQHKLRVLQADCIVNQ